MKLFRHGRQRTEPSISDPQKLLDMAIKSARADRDIDAIADLRGAELVVDRLFESFGDLSDARSFRNPEHAPEADRERLLDFVAKVSEILTVEVPSEHVRVALGAFVFQAGVAFGAPAHIVQAGIESMFIADDIRAYEFLADVDSDFFGQLKSYLAELSPQEFTALMAAISQIGAANPKFAQVSRLLDQPPTADQTRSTGSIDKVVRPATGANSIPTPKFCRDCGNPLKTSARFCGFCGSPIAK